MTLDPIAMATRGYVCGAGPDPISIATGGYICILVAELDRLADPRRFREPFDLGYYRTKYAARIQRERTVTPAQAEEILAGLDVQGQSLRADLEELELEIGIYLDAEAEKKIIVGDVAQILAGLEEARQLVLDARKRQNNEIAAIAAVMMMYYH